MRVSQFSVISVVLTAIFLLFIPANIQAATHVVLEGESIADILAISAPGDSVLVAPGEYREFGLIIPSGIYLGVYGDVIAFAPRLISDNGETILHCEDLGADTAIKGFAFVGDFSRGERHPSRGQGIHSINSSAVISDCTFTNLKAAYGGAVFVGKGAAPSFIGCRFEGNMAMATGGAISVVGGQDLVLDHCLFVLNTASAGGSVLNVALGASAQITSCTFDGNGDAAKGDIQSWASGLIEISHCIMSGSSGRTVYGDYASTPEFHCTDLALNDGGNWIGALMGQAETQGNISLPPIFCGEQNEFNPYTLHEDSPCVADCGTMGAFDVGCDGTAGSHGFGVVQTDENALPTVTQLRGNYPNPFNPQTTIAFELSQSGQAAVDVYDLAGRLVRKLHSGVLAAGPHEVMWNGRGSDGRMSAAGIYFFRLKTETVIDTQRMMLVK